MLGFTFNGHHSSEYEIYMRSRNRQLLPSIRQVEEVIPGMHGVYDYSSGELEDRIIEVDCAIVGDLRSKARQIASWLYSATRGKLIFDDEPDKYYLAKINNRIDLEQTINLGRFTLQFKCEPFAYTDKSLSFSTKPEVIIINSQGTYKTPFVISIKNNGSVNMKNIKILLYKG
ncbi:hypothetical protein DXT63_08440 [Thermoanaerobacteraceae bacterium SP2]|nr:hypothetical protein DXT63_08440 [Thermoanaerobacteraceae bacterium SP2]